MIDGLEVIQSNKYWEATPPICTQIGDEIHLDHQAAPLLENHPSLIRSHSFRWGVILRRLRIDRSCIVPPGLNEFEPTRASWLAHLAYKVPETI